MVFLTPLLLLGLFAVLIPVAIHLIRRERPPKVVFGSIRFLKNTPKKLILFQRLQQWLLLALRALVVALLVIAFARPLLNQSLARLLDAEPQSAVLVLDATMSMRYDNIFAAAKERAEEFVDALSQSDEAAIVVLTDSAQVLVELTSDKASLVRALDSLAEPSFGASDLRAGLVLGNELLESATFENRSLTLISDFQAGAADSLDGSWKLAPGIEFSALDVGVDETTNLNVADLRVPADLLPGAVPAPILARISTNGTLALEQAQVTLRIDGSVVERQAVSLTDVSERVIQFDYAFEQSETGVTQAVEVRVEGDQFADDNSRFALVRFEPQVRVVVVDGEYSPNWYEDEAHWFTLASGGEGSSFDVETVLPSELTAALIEQAEVIVLLNVRDLGAQQSAALSRFVNAGGGLLIAPGDRATDQGGSLQSELPARLNGSPRLAAGDYRVVAEFERRHPLFAKLPFEWESRFTRVWSLESAADANILMRFDDASAALVERESGAGRILMTAMPLDSEWGDFPLKPLYLPFVHESLTYLAARATVRQDYLVGELPREQRLSLTSSPRPGLLGVGSTQLAVNVDSTESSLARVASSAVFDTVINPENATLAPRATRVAARLIELENPQRLWWWLLCLVMLLVLAETVIANRSHR